MTSTHPRTCARCHRAAERLRLLPAWLLLDELGQMCDDCIRWYEDPPEQLSLPGTTARARARELGWPREEGGAP